MGKTSIALNIALHVAKTSGKTVAIFSIEMSKEQLALRLLSSASHIDGKKLQTGRLTTDEWTRLGQTASMLSGYDLQINDNPSLSVADMNAQCRRRNNLALWSSITQLMRDGARLNNGGETGRRLSLISAA
jgi:replicative DNA helicase